MLKSALNISWNTIFFIIVFWKLSLRYLKFFGCLGGVLDAGETTMDFLLPSKEHWNKFNQECRLLINGIHTLKKIILYNYKSNIFLGDFWPRSGNERLEYLGWGFPVSKLHQRHKGRLRKRDTLLRGVGGAKSYDGEKSSFSIIH